MAIVINGSGTLSGLAVGGLPDGTVDAGTLATDSVTAAKIATNSVDSAELIDGAIDNSHIAALAASKLTGALPAISGAALTSLIGSLSYNGGTTLGNLRIQAGTITTSDASADGGSAYGVSTKWYSTQNITLSGFASAPNVFAQMDSGWHDVRVNSSIGSSATNAIIGICCSRQAGIQSKPLSYIAIGEAS
jgi:hypothetical protein